MGETGSGKTTLINAMINYILGVEWDDPFRYKLIDEKFKASQAHSQTETVTAYDIYWTPGMRIDFSLTIVDTPGYGDTRGIERDQQITEIVKQFFNDRYGIQEVNAVGFVVAASSVRLTPTQRYVFDKILEIFSKDIERNICLLLTFADMQRPQVLDSIIQAQVPCHKDEDGQPSFNKFNSSALFVPKTDQLTDLYNSGLWSLGADNFKQFFMAVGQLNATSLTLTKEVLEERKQLEAKVEGIQS